MKRWLLPLLFLPVFGCVSPLEQGELLYREGDRLGALEIWRAVPKDHPQQSEVNARVEVVEADLAQLAVKYVDRASTLEEEGRLAESILDFRLALELEPDDAPILAHVQQIARTLVEQKASLRTTYEEDLSAGDLEAARGSLSRLRRLDPFDPEYETEARQIEAALRIDWQRREARTRAKLAPEVDGLVEAGRDAFRNEQLETALAMWRRALLIDPNNERVQAYIASAERQLESLDALRDGDATQ
jgi:tetratricopeptide (TPR) repeat protein